MAVHGSRAGWGAAALRPGVGRGADTCPAFYRTVRVAVAWCLSDPLVPVTLDGRKVLVLNQRNGAKLYVAATGPAFPLRTDEKAGHVQFSEYGVDFHITAPADVVDLNAAG